MGKSKQPVAQRTKGNVKASSSGRAADALGAATGVIGFEALSSTNADLGDSDLNSEWKLISKKLSKKDGVTRLKGLQELSSLVPQAPEAELTAFLPLWPKYFARSSLDYDRRLREAAHVVHQKIVARLKKQIAPQLKQLMGPWIVGLCDPWNNSANAAQAAFAEAFPTQKQRGAVLFCIKEVISFLKDNILLPPNGDAGLSKEEAEAQWENAVVTSLKALAWVFRAVFEDRGEETQEVATDGESKRQAANGDASLPTEPVIQAYQSLIQETKFWELAKRKKNPPIVGAWFSVMLAILTSNQSSEILGTQETSKLLKNTVNALDSDDPSLTSAVWSCLVHFLTKYEDWHVHVNAEGVIVPKFLCFLRNGGRGSSISVYGLVPKIFAVLRSQVLDANKFTAEFLKSLRLGLFSQRVIVSPMETEAVSRSIFETVAVITGEIAAATENEEERDRLREVASIQLAVLVDEAVCEARNEVCAQAVAAGIGQLLSMTVKSEFKDDVGLWERILPAFERVARAGPARARKNLTRFLVELKRPAARRSRRGGRGVRFGRDGPPEVEPAPEENKLPQFVVAGVAQVVECALEAMKNSQESDSVENAPDATGAFDLVCAVVETYAKEPEFRPGGGHGELFSHLLPRCVEGPLTPAVFSALFSLLDPDPGRLLDSSWDDLYSVLKSRKKRSFAENLILMAVKLKDKLPAAACMLTDDRLSHILVDCAKEIVDAALASFSVPPSPSVSSESFRYDDAPSKNVESSWKILQAVLTSAELKPLVSPVAVESVMIAFENGLNQAATFDLSDPDARDRAVSFVVRLCTDLVPLLLVRMLMASPAPAEGILMCAVFLAVENEALAEDREAVNELMRGIETGIAGLFEVQETGILLGPEGFLIHFVRRLEQCLTALRRSNSSWNTAAIEVLSDVAVLIVRNAPDAGIRTRFLARLVESAIDGMSIDTVYDPAVALSWAVSKALPFYSGEPLSEKQKERRMRMPAYSLFISSVLQRVTSPFTTTSSPDGSSGDVQPARLTTWEELSAASGSSLTDLMAWLWSTSRYMTCLRQLWWQTAKRGWVEQLSIAEEKLAKNCELMSEDAGLPIGVKMMAFETVLNRALCPDDSIDSGLASLCLADFILPERKRDVPAEMRALIAGGFAKYVGERGSTTAGVFHQVMAPLLLKDDERLEALQHYVDNLDQCLSSPSGDTIDCQALVNNVSGALKVYGVPLGKPDVGSTKSLLNALKKVWNVYLGRSLDRGLNATTALNDVNLNLLVCAAMRKIVATWQSDWDAEFAEGFEFIFISCSKWLLALGVDLKTASWRNLQENHVVTLTLATSVCDLIAAVADLMRREMEAVVDLSPVQRELAGLPRVVERVWLETSDAIFSFLLPAFISIARSVPSVEQGGNSTTESGLIVALCDTFLESLCAAVVAGSSVRVSADEVARLPSDLMPLLLSVKKPVQEVAFRILLRIFVSMGSDESLLPSVTVEGSRSVDEDEMSEPPVVKHPPALLLEKIRSTGEVVDAMLMEHPVGGSICTIEPHTDSYTYAMGYLMSWQLLLSMWSQLSSHTKDNFAEIMRFGACVYPWSIFGAKDLERLLNNVFRLMPPEADFTEGSARGIAVKSWSYAPTPAAGPGKDEVGPMMTTPLVGSGGSLALQACADDVAHFACRTYVATAEAFPVLTRNWFNAISNGRVQDAVGVFTARHVTPLIWAKELVIIQAEAARQNSAGAASGLNEVTFRAREMTREVIVSNKVDEALLDMILSIPANFPLSAVKVDAGKRFVSRPTWMKWIMRLGMYLTHKRSTIVEAIRFWKNNIDKQFDGVEECCICYNVLHSFNNQLPNKACRTCKKKFHGQCLDKWFATSSNSTCPLCRERFF